MSSHDQTHGEKKPSPIPETLALSADVKLQIIETVEDRLCHLPAETYKLIQKEVDDRVEAVHKQYRALAYVITGAIGVLGAILVTICGVTIHNVPDRVDNRINEVINSKRVKEQIDEIGRLHDHAVSLDAAIESQENLTEAASGLVKQRLAELQKQDNLVLIDDLQTLFVVESNLTLIDGKMIILKYEPIPQTVNFTCTQYFPAYWLNAIGVIEGKTIKFNERGQGVMGDLVHQDGFKIEYVRKSLH